jgi:uncharacterized repeat protein (TIGR01451 family)
VPRLLTCLAGLSVAVVLISSAQAVPGAPAQASGLDISKVASVDTVEVGGRLTYTVTVKNLGPGPSDVLGLDALPPEVGFISATPSQGGACGLNERGLVQCPLGRIEAGQQATFTIVVHVRDLPASGEITNRCTAFGSRGSADQDHCTLTTELTPVVLLLADLLAIDRRLDALIRQVQRFGRRRLLPGSRIRIRILNDDIRTAVARRALADGSRFGQVFPSLLAANLHFEVADAHDDDRDAARHLDSAAASLRGAAKNPMSVAAGTAADLNRLADQAADLARRLRSDDGPRRQVRDQAIFQFQQRKLGIMEKYPNVLGLPFVDVYEALSRIHRQSKIAAGSRTSQGQLEALQRMRAAKVALENNMRAAGR